MLLAMEEVDKDSVDGKGMTPLHLASLNGDAPTVQALVNAGADIRLRLGATEVGLRALHLANHGGHEDVAQVLRDAGMQDTPMAPAGSDLLHESAKHNNVPMIDFLVLKANVDVDARDDGGRTPLHTAAVRDAPKAMATLVKHRADTGARDKFDQTPLCLAACSAGAAAIDVLHAAGVDLNLRTSIELPYLPDHEDWSALDFASNEGNEAALRALVRHGADLKACSEKGLTVMNSAAGGNRAAMIDTLIGLGIDVHGSRDGQTPLDNAIQAHSPDALRALVRHGADVNKANADHETPLQVAVPWAHLGLDVMEALLAAGANPDMAGKGAPVLRDAVSNCDFQEIATVLLAGGANINARGLFDGVTVLIEAAESEGADDIDFLIQAGADMDMARFQDRHTALHVACSTMNACAVTSLLRHGADVNVADRTGNTPLHLAAMAGGSPHGVFRVSPRQATFIVDCLLRTGADETIVNDGGRTPCERIRRELTASKYTKAVLKLLKRAPRDRTWRRRAPWVMCRAYADKARLQPQVGQAKVPRRDMDVGSDDGNDDEAAEEAPDVGDFSAIAARVAGLDEGPFRAVISYL